MTESKSMLEIAAPPCGGGALGGAVAPADGSALDGAEPPSGSAAAATGATPPCGGAAAAGVRPTVLFWLVLAHGGVKVMPLAFCLLAFLPLSRFSLMYAKIEV